MHGATYVRMVPDSERGRFALERDFERFARDDDYDGGVTMSWRTGWAGCVLRLLLCLLSSHLL